MNSNRKSTSEKPKGVETDSSPGPIKLIGTPYVSLDHSISNPHSKQAKGEASVTSGLTKLSGKTSVSSGILIGVPKSRNPNGMKTGVSSGVRGKAVVSSGAKGKAIVSTEVVAFKGVKYGAPDGELRFRLIHFWEVRNVVTKVLLGALALSSMTPSRVFLDTDVQATRDYLTWMNTDLDVANRVDADIVTKTETVTIGELFSYMKQEDAKVVQYQLATKGPTSLMCKKCGKPEIAGVAQYLAKIFVYDNDDQASFLLLGGAGYELSGKKASELVEDYFEANEDVGDDHLVPVPQALIDTIGQTRKFVVKVSNHNLTGQTQALTVTKVLTPEVPEVEANLEGNVAVPDAQETLDKEVAGDGPSTFFVSVKRVAGQADAEDPKRAGNG
ncbi:hypothetical protein Bca52824_056840 [Brassica carinata]|uniref:Uncharacterized protein n=1 Tax=Brassica carinata TaxID=52824 RepID=A0A8X7QTM0_BRACI|nr:hypothetical protein Bca52824_056840 [Brassica carinata]